MTWLKLLGALPVDIATLALDILRDALTTAHVDSIARTAEEERWRRAAQDLVYFVEAGILDIPAHVVEDAKRWIGRGPR